MSTIPLTFDDQNTPYTIVGNTAQDCRKDSLPLFSILLLNRGGKFHREELLHEIYKIDFAEILYIEGPEFSYDIEQLSRKYPEVKFLLCQSQISTGEKINIGMEESQSHLVFVFWSNNKIVSNSITAELIKRTEQQNVLCSVPVMKNIHHKDIPSIQVPGFIKGNLKVVPWSPVKNSIESIFPFDYCGIYNRKKYYNIGGFDNNIKNPYWQKLDFGFRAFMWGERIRLDTGFVLQYLGDTEVENSSPDKDYKIFFLKNIFVKYKNNAGFIPLYKLLNYLYYSDSGPVRSIKEFITIRKWVRENKDRYKNDAKALVKLWKVPE